MKLILDRVEGSISKYFFFDIDEISGKQIGYVEIGPEEISLCIDTFRNKVILPKSFIPAVIDLLKRYL